MRSNFIKSTVEVPRVPKLESPNQWLDWFSTVRSIAQGLEIWHIKASEDKRNEVRENIQHPRWVGLRRYYEIEKWDVRPLW